MKSNSWSAENSIVHEDIHISALEAWSLWCGSDVLGLQKQDVWNKIFILLMKYGNIILGWESWRVNLVFFCFSYNPGKGIWEGATVVVWLLSHTWPVTNPNIKKICQVTDLSLQWGSVFSVISARFPFPNLHGWFGKLCWSLHFRATLPSVTRLLSVSLGTTSLSVPMIFNF